MLGNYIIILILSALFGFTLKMADLLDEHGLKLFKGAPLLFGVAWGLIGSLLMLGNNTIAVFILAILLHWILRYRIDYLNHGVASAMTLITFLFNLPNFTMDWLIFLTIFIPYSFFGLLNDMADRGELKGKLAVIVQKNIHLIIFPAILTLINLDYWIILGSSFAQILFYNLTKKYGMRIASQ